MTRRASNSEMEPVTMVVDKLKGFAKSTREFAHGLLYWRHNSNGRNPIDILKRLQREAFSDIMKLRDRQDKVERLLAYKSSKGSPFHEASTHVRGKVDILGALFLMDGLDEQKNDAIQKSGIRTGIDARLTFETTVRDTDTLEAEFIATGKGQGDMLGGPLSLAKVLYTAHFSDWFSAVAVPMGAQCRDVGLPTSTHQERALSNYSEFGPPLLHQQHNGSGIGIMVRKANIVASLAQFVSGLGMQVNSDRLAFSLSTFGQVVWELRRNTKLSLLGVRKERRSSGENINLGPLAFPVNIFQHNRTSETSIEEDSVRNTETHSSDGSIALMFNSEIVDGAKIGGWIETKTSNPDHLQWAFTMSDTPEDEPGWGLTLGGLFQGPKNLEHFQVETFLNVNFGKRFTLKPGILYVKDGTTQFPALMFSCNCSL